MKDTIHKTNPLPPMFRGFTVIRTGNTKISKTLEQNAQDIEKLRSEGIKESPFVVVGIPQQG